MLALDMISLNQGEYTLMMYALLLSVYCSLGALLVRQTAIFYYCNLSWTITWIHSALQKNSLPFFIYTVNCFLGRCLVLCGSAINRYGRCQSFLDSLSFLILCGCSSKLIYQNGLYAFIFDFVLLLHRLLLRTSWIPCLVIYTLYECSRFDFC